MCGIPVSPIIIEGKKRAAEANTHAEVKWKNQDDSCLRNIFESAKPDASRRELSANESITPAISYIVCYAPENLFKPRKDDIDAEKFRRTSCCITPHAFPQVFVCEKAYYVLRESFRPIENDPLG